MAIINRNKTCINCETDCLSCDDVSQAGSYAKSHLQERYQSYHENIGYEAGQLPPGLEDDLRRIRDLSLDDDIRFIANRWIPD